MSSSVPATASSLSRAGDREKPTAARDRSHSICLALLAASVSCLLAALIGCQPRVKVPPVPVSYEDLCGLASGQMGGMDEESVRRWIEEEYNDSPLESQKVMGGEAIAVYVWEHNGTTGNAYLRDGCLFRISLIDLEGKAEGQPTFGQIVAGLGPPEIVDRYAQRRERVLYDIALEYPALGVSVSTTNIEKQSKLMHEGRLAVPLTEDMKAKDIHCYTPGPMEEVLRDVFFLAPDYVSYHMDRRMPWPGFGALVPLEY